MKNIERFEQMKTMLLDGNTYQEIGTQFGLSRQRIQQLVSPDKTLLAMVKSRAKNRCEKCGIKIIRDGSLHHKNHKDTSPDIYNAMDNLLYLCRSCHRKEHRILPIKKCRNCGKPAPEHKCYCCDDCKKKYHEAELTCSYCGRKFRTLKHDAESRTRKSKSGLLFCNKVCQGKYIAKHYGWGTQVSRTNKLDKAE